MKFLIKMIAESMRDVRLTYSTTSMATKEPTDFVYVQFAGPAAHHRKMFSAN